MGGGAIKGLPLQPSSNFKKKGGGCRYRGSGEQGKCAGERGGGEGRVPRVERGRRGARGAIKEDVGISQAERLNEVRLIGNRRAGNTGGEGGGGWGGWGEAALRRYRRRGAGREDLYVCVVR